MDDIYLGALCKRGHDYQGTGKSQRDPKWYKCLACLKEKTAERKEYFSAYAKSENGRTSQANYRATDKSREVKQRYANKPQAKLLKQQRARERYNRVEFVAVSSRIRSLVKKYLRKYGNGKSKRLASYGIYPAAIYAHLGPCPGIRSEYHIDHIRPVCSFDLTDPQQIKAAFLPENHQWLPALENLKKGKKLPPMESSD
jgi:hypothetical protein